MNDVSSDSDKIAARAEAAFASTVERLSRYLRFPAISSDPAHAGDVRALAAAIRDDLEALGLERARLLEVEGAHPCVAAEHTKAGPNAP
ncbi:MAG: hypothetical protein K8H88_09490, partial [Sandaracinaceae bacterium]|nr:hypothetical protein [Sandaracinaceae bacterium]